MRTCWVLDHPAQRLLAPFIRRDNLDVLIATDRQEVRQLLDSAEGVLPKRQQIWVHRPVGSSRLAWKQCVMFDRFSKSSSFRGSP